MERRPRQAAESEKAKALTVRARRRSAIPGKRGIDHQWANLPDVAETIVQLAGKEGLEDFATFHMGGHRDADGIRRALGEPAVPVKPTSRLLMRLLLRSDAFQVALAADAARSAATKRWKAVSAWTDFASQGALPDFPSE